MRGGFSSFNIQLLSGSCRKGLQEAASLLCMGSVASQLLDKARHSSLSVLKQIKYSHF